MKKLWHDINITSENTLLPSGVTHPDKVISLNGTWQFKFFDTVNDVSDNYFKPEIDRKDFDSITVPSNWQLLGYGVPNYLNFRYPKPVESKKRKQIPTIYDEINPAGIYCKTFEIDSLDDNIYIEFGGINSAGTIYLNGEYVGYSTDTFDAVTYDITKHAIVGKNYLVVLVVQFSIGSYLECQDMWRLAGIFRDVNLLFVPKTNIKDVFLKSEVSQDFLSVSLCTNVKIAGTTSNSVAKVTLYGQDGEILYTESQKASAELTFASPKLHNIKLWNHELPTLYTVEITIVKDKNILDKRVFKHGFRKVEIIREKNEQPFIALNGKLIKICGVNRHDFHPDYGHAVPKAIIDSDLALLKANNITSVRTCHYPNTSYFYSRCDELGILVMSENNLETHGLAKIIPSNNKKWSKHCCFRMRNMVHTFKNHASIISWSLGNEAGVGQSFFDMRLATLEIDDTRIIHYEPMPAASDVLSQMYTVQTKMQKIADNRTIIHSRALWNNMLGMLMLPKDYQDKPFMLCEYSHCMGNSLGNFSDYWKDFEANPRLTGGYIWDFSDQSIKRVNSQGITEWTMGGDYGDYPNDGVFAFNGIVRADRTPNPALFEVKKQYERISTYFDGKELRVTNNRSFASMSDLYIEMQKLEDGIMTESINVNILPIAASTSASVKVPNVLLKGKGEVILSVLYKLKEATAYAPQNHIVASAQFVLKSAPLPSFSSDAAPKIECDNDKIKILVKDGYYVFNQKTGGIDSAVINGKELLASSIMPNFWRAFTNNDKYPPNEIIDIAKFLRLDKYKRAMKKLKARLVETSFTNNALVIRVYWKMPLVCDFSTTYLFSKNGIINMDMKVLPLRDMVRYGITFMLNSGISNVQFYGKGPHENYCDRATSAMLGLYQGNVEDFVHDYLSPQENGNHMETRFVQIDNGNLGVKINAESHPFEFSAHPYTLSMLEKATHLHKLERLDKVTVNIDGGQRGVGGDIPAIAMTKKQYKLKKLKQYKLSCNIQFFDKGTNDENKMV